MQSAFGLLKIAILSVAIDPAGGLAIELASVASQQTSGE